MSVALSPGVSDVLWQNQQVVNGHATAECRDLIGDELIGESLIRKIVRKIDVPSRRVMVSPMTKPVEVLKTPAGHEIPGPFFALTRKLFRLSASCWNNSEDEVAWRVAREITAELYLDVLTAQDEATKKKPFRGLIYAPFVLVMLAPVSSGEIGIKMRYSKRVV